MNIESSHRLCSVESLGEAAKNNPTERVQCCTKTGKQFDFCGKGAQRFGMEPQWCVSFLALGKRDVFWHLLFVAIFAAMTSESTWKGSFLGDVQLPWMILPRYVPILIEGSNSFEPICIFPVRNTISHNEHIAKTKVVHVRKAMQDGVAAANAQDLVEIRLHDDIERMQQSTAIFGGETLADYEATLQRLREHIQQNNAANLDNVPPPPEVIVLERDCIDVCTPIACDATFGHL
jgi:hypothetical protein